MILDKIFVLGSERIYEFTIFTFPYTIFADKSAFKPANLTLAFKR
jgi:hypothetical protein